jgi:DUF1365 family protein
MRPRAHRLKYRIFMLLLDLDEIDRVATQSRLFSRNRFNLMSFHDRDHGDRTGAPLRRQIEGHLAAARLGEAGASIRLLTMPRVLGYVFNPISVYFCHRADGTLGAILYEVSNTFGERHSYLIPVEEVVDGQVRQSCGKALHVSPFIAMDVSYDFRVAPPGERVTIAIAEHDADGLLLTASFAARRQALGDGALLRAFVTHPLLTLKVIGGIHWEALLLWIKGVPLTDRPTAPDEAVTLVAADAADPQHARPAA